MVNSANTESLLCGAFVRRSLYAICRLSRCEIGSRNAVARDRQQCASCEDIAKVIVRIVHAE